jgi:hypothetical protein
LPMVFVNLLGKRLGILESWQFQHPYPVQSLAKNSHTIFVS